MMVDGCLGRLWITLLALHRSSYVFRALSHRSVIINHFHQGCVMHFRIRYGPCSSLALSFVLSFDVCSTCR